MKGDIWDIKDQSKNLIKNLKSKCECGYGYAYCSYISLAKHFAKIYEKIPRSICGEMIIFNKNIHRTQTKNVNMDIPTALIHP